MTAAWMWARADLRSRWRSWVLLGILGGVTFGLVAAGVAGARRTARAVPALAAASHIPDAAVLANDPAFDATQRAAVARLPEVAQTFPFMVAFGTTVLRPARLGAETSHLVPTAARSIPTLTGALVAGRLPDPRRADEVVVDENARDRFHLDLGATLVVGQSKASVGVVPPDFLPAGVSPEFRQTMHVVGIAKSQSSDLGWTASSGLYRKYSERMVGVVNLMVDLRHGDRQVGRLDEDVTRIVGHPVNVESGRDLFGIRKAENVTSFERDGLLLFALAALLGGGVLVGQALVRAVSAGAADLPTWRAMGADRHLAVRALVLPALVTALVGAVTTVVVAIALSPRFPIGLARLADLDVGVHADWFVLGLAAFALVVATVVAAALTAWWRATRADRGPVAPSSAGRWAVRLGWSPAFVIGSRLAVEPGRGRRAVPVRSALVGAVVGVLGVVACFTFRAGLEDAVARPQRSGVVWDYAFAAGGGPIPAKLLTAVAHEPAVGGALRATWMRAVPVDGNPVPVFATTRVKGTMPLVVLEGRRPRRATEIAFAPTTMRELHTRVGDRVRVGSGHGVSMMVVGKVLLPGTSHTDYDQSGWITATGARRALGRPDDTGEDYLLLRWRTGAPAAPIAAARARLTRIGGPDLFAEAATLPTAVADLVRLETLPFVLGVFFALLACATVAHALVTTARRRRHDFAVLRAVGFTRRQSRVAVAWQATLLAALGVLIGVPLGLVAGRAAWRWLAHDFPIAYFPPLALVAVLVVVPVALIVANALAAVPARSVARIRPAETLRAE